MSCNKVKLSEATIQTKLSHFFNEKIRKAFEMLRIQICKPLMQTSFKL